MERITVLGPERFSLLPDQAEVFGWLGCGGDIPCRGAFERAWDPAVDILMENMAPQAVSAHGKDGSLTVFMTLGPGPEEQMTELFRRQEYVMGSLLNTLSDEMLFQMDRQATALIAAMLREEHRYAAARLEPGAELTPDAQRERLAPVRTALPFVRISDTGVLFPTKLMMYVLELSEKPCRHEIRHDCGSCPQKDCVYRHR